MFSIGILEVLTQMTNVTLSGPKLKKAIMQSFVLRKQSDPTLIPLQFGKWLQSVIISFFRALRRGILMGWNATIFKGDVIFSTKSANIVHFTSMHNGDQWKLTTMYGHVRVRKDRISLNVLTINKLMIKKIGCFFWRLQLPQISRKLK
jgi:hypothetical protein